MRAGASAFFCLASALSAAMPATAADTAHDWRVIQDNVFRQGFVAGIASYLLNQSESTKRAGYAECFFGRTDVSLLGVVDDYMDHHPESADYTPDITVGLALGELCAGYLPRPPTMPQ
jgi:hypothetical protein